MALIVGIHGIMKQQLGRNLMISAWAPALADGIEREVGHPVGLPEIDVAFFGDLFLPKVGRNKKGPGSDDLVDMELDELTEAEVATLAGHAEEVIGADGLAEGDLLDDTEKAYTRAPSPVQWLLRGLDKRFGSRMASRLFLGEVRQVRRYLLDQEIKTETDQRVADAMDNDGSSARVLIGHSLGSVVAFEYLRQHRNRQVELLLTFGSPLGLKTVQALMPHPTYGSDWLPRNVSRWVNLRDPHDPVTCAGDLSLCWPGIEDDDTVRNQDDAHAADRYLAKRQAGAAVTRTLPHLAEPEQR